jgi:hypothetical protein
MRRNPRPRQDERGTAMQETKPLTAVDLGLALSIYAKREDGSLFEIGDPASPLFKQSAAGTWPTEQ